FGTYVLYDGTMFAMRSQLMSFTVEELYVLAWYRALASLQQVALQCRLMSGERGCWAYDDATEWSTAMRTSSLKSPRRKADSSLRSMAVRSRSCRWLVGSSTSPSSQSVVTSSSRARRTSTSGVGSDLPFSYLFIWLWPKPRRSASSSWVSWRLRRISRRRSPRKNLLSFAHFPTSL